MSALADPAREPGAYASAGLSLLMHGALLALLIYGVRWQSRPADVVQVDLVSAPSPRVVAPAPPPVAVPPKPEPKVEPPKPVPKPAPPPKADIAIKDKEKPKPVTTAAPPKPEPQTDRRALDEQLRREEQQVAEQRMRLEAEREADALKAQQAVAARQRALAGWVDRIRAKIRGNIALPPGLRGNPEAIFEVTQLPTGEVLGVKLKRSTGTQALDEAIERAILKSSPLPKPDQPELFARVLELKFRPLED